MKNHIYEYLYLTRQERNGLVIIMCLSALIAFLPTIYSHFEEREMTDFSIFQNEINSFLEAIPISKPIAFGNTSYSKKKEPNVKKKEIEYFPFDPNLASKEEFIRLGLSSKTAQTILNFRNKGAIFFKKEDFKKVYGLSNTDYSRLEKYIQIQKEKSQNPIATVNTIPQTYDSPEVNHTPFDPNIADEKLLLQNGIPTQVVATIIKYRDNGGSFKTKEDLKKIYTLKDEVYQKIEPYIDIPTPSKKIIVKASPKRINPSKDNMETESITIDINNSAPEEWQKLRGIGPSFSKRIVNFRDKLGGFYSIEQVGETFGLPDSTFQSIKSQLQPSSIYKKINLNQATEEQLKKHPYISWNQAKLIVSYRNMHGHFKDVNELLKIGTFKEEWLDKVKHYLIL